MLIILIAGIDINLIIVYKKKHIYKKLLLFSTFSILILAILYITLIILPYNLLSIAYAAPFGLLIGPYIMFFKSIKINNKKSSYLKYLHIAPFLIAFIFYIFFLIKDFTSNNTIGNNEYFYVLYFISACSWLLYSLYLVYDQFSRKASSAFVEVGYFLPDATSYVFLILASVYNIAVILTRNDDISFIIRTYNFSLLFLLLWFLFIFHYAITNMLSLSIHTPVEEVNNNETRSVSKSKSFVESNIEIKYEKSQLSEKQIAEYKKKIENYISKEPYLNPDFNLETMSDQLKIYKHHCSQFFNLVYGMNFLKYINKLRIEKACYYIDNEENLTIDEISIMCGFNSRASFYRNFTTIMGCSTTEYKQRNSNSKIA
jgi:AraC-like DNA-binding protein